MLKNIPPFNLTAFLRGFSLPLRGFRFLFANRGLKRYAILPLLLNVVLYGAATIVLFYFLWRWDIYQVEWNFLGPVGGWLAAAANWLGWLVKLPIAMVVLAATYFTFTGVGMAIASPINDILSEKVEMTFVGGRAKMEMPFRFTAKAALVSFGDSLRTLLRQLACTVLALPFLLVPVVGFIPLFVVGAYFSGFGFLDTAMARNFLRPRHKKPLVEKDFWEIMGFGSAMQIIFAIPFAGMLLMPVGVASGTLLYCGQDWEALLSSSQIEPPTGFVPPRSERVGGENR